MNGNFLYSSRVDGEVLRRLHSAGIQTALVDLRSFRVRNYWRQPQLMIRDGWQIDPEVNTRREHPRSWILGDPRQTGQKLVFDRNLGRIKLTSYSRGLAQEVVLDLNTDQILANRMTG